MATDEGAQAPTKSRSLFSKRPAWAKTTAAASPTDAPEELFTRRKLAPEELLRQKEEQQRLEAEEDARRAAARAERQKRKAEKEALDSPNRKRITGDTYALFGLPSPLKNAARESNDSAGNTTGSQSPTKAQQAESGQNKSHDQSKTVIEICSDDEGDGSETLAGNPQLRNDRSPSPNESEEAFPELAAIARERRMQRKAAAEQAQATGGASLPLTQTEPEFDPKLEILITSPIANTNPLLVHRKLSQRLMEVRQVWCERQAFPPEQAAEVFLTYKLRRIYDSTTCKSLGIKVDFDGHVYEETQDSTLRSMMDSRSAGKVHLLALTEDALKELKQKREEERAKTSALAAFETPEYDEPEPVEQQQGSKIKIVIKSKGRKDYKVVVRPETTCARVLEAFRKEYKVDDETELVLTFDGEALEPEATMAETEVEDMDNLEVHVRS